MRKLKEAKRRQEVLLQLQEQLCQDALVLEKIKLKNEKIKRAMSTLRAEIADHLHLLSHAIRRREKRAHDQSVGSQRAEASQE